MWCSAADTYRKLLGRVVSGAVFNWECAVTLHIVDLLQNYLCCIITGITRCTLFIVHYTRAVCARADYTRCFCCTSEYLCGSSQYRRTLVPSQRLCVTILLTLYSMVSDWRVSRARPINFHWLSCSLAFCLLVLSLSLLSFYRLVLWAWGFRTDGV